ncbi:MAG: hypothetical protein AAFR65_14025 [Pseudomonadota bacterium]
MTIEDPKTAQNGLDANGPKALRNLVLVLLLVLLGTAGGLATFGLMMSDDSDEMTEAEWVAARERAATADEAYGVLDPERTVALEGSEESIDAFRERSEAEVREFYEAQEEGLYQRIVDAGLYGKGSDFDPGDDPSEWTGMGGPETEAVKIVPTSLGGSADGTFSGIPTAPLQASLIDPLVSPAAATPLGPLPQIVFPGLSGPGGVIVPPPTITGPPGEVPVPGALLLFPAGLAFLAKAKKRRAA